MVSLKSRSQAGRSDVEVSSSSGTRRKRRPKTDEGESRRRRSAKEEEPRRRRRRSSPKEEAREPSPPPLRRKSARSPERRKSARSPERRRSSPRDSTRSRHRDGGRASPEKGFGYRALSRALPDAGKRKSPDSGRRKRSPSPSKKEKDVVLPKQQEEKSFQKAQQAIFQAVRSGAAPKRSSRKAEERASEEDIDGQPVGAPANRQPSASASAPALDIVGYNIDGEKLSERRSKLPNLEVAADSDIEREFGKASDGAPQSQPSPNDDPSDSDEQMHGDVDRSPSPESNRPNKEAKSNPRLQTEADDDQEKQERRQERETFQDRLRRKQMERKNPPEVPKKDVKVVPDKSALQVAALAIKAAAAAGSASAEKDERQEDSPEAKRPLTRTDRTRVCAERAAALGLSCDFVVGRLLPAERARVLIDAGRRRRRGEHVDTTGLAPLPSEEPPPPPKVEAEPVDQESVIRAAEASQAAFCFADFLASRSRAVQAPVQLAPVSEQLQQRIQVAAITRAKKAKKKKQGRDFDYDPNVDGESMSSGEEKRCMDEIDGSSMDTDDEREAVYGQLDGQNAEKKHLGAKKLLCGHGGLDDVFM